MAKTSQSFHLERAAKKGDEIWARECLDRGLDPNGRDGLGTTPIMDAAQKGHLNVVNLLLERMANVNASRTRGFEGFRPAAPILEDGRNALCDAAAHGHCDVILALVAAKAYLDLPGPIGRTAISWAVLHDHADAVRELIHARADVNHRDQFGDGPLMFAQSDTARMLVAARADPSLREDSSGAVQRTLMDNKSGRWPILQLSRSATALGKGDNFGLHAAACGAYRRGRDDQPWSVTRLDKLLDKTYQTKYVEAAEAKAAFVRMPSVSGPPILPRAAVPRAIDTAYS